MHTNGSFSDLMTVVLFFFNFQSQMLASSLMNSAYESTFAVIAHVGYRQGAQWIAHIPQPLQL